MKISNSTIQFNFSCTRTPKGERCTIDNVPYWKLYSRDGDCIQNDIGRQWCSTRVLTYAEIVEYLQNFPRHRVLVAYPRFSENTRNVFEYYYDKPNDEFGIYNPHTGEVYYIVNAATGKQIYLSPDYKGRGSYFWKKFFIKALPPEILYSWRGWDFISKTDN